MRSLRLLPVVALVLAASPHAHAHPVPSRIYERTVVVHLSASAVTVAYQLDVDEFTAELDLLAVRDKTNLADLTTREEVRNAFLGAYGPILADNLVAELNEKPLMFRCTEQKQHVEEGHLRCNFTFFADVTPKPGDAHRFHFRDGNYETEAGLLRLSLTSDDSVSIIEKTQPDEALQAKSPLDRKPGDEDRLRSATALYRVTEPHAAAQTPTMNESEPSASPSEWFALRDLIRNPERDFWALMFLAAVFGAAHALTPGHGKTLVAAYLVGERGTVWHALFLGLVTTLTHTGAVIGLAAVLWVFPNLLDRADFALRLAAGLLAAGMGLWLLLRRLSGQADHFHIGGHDHHHHHGDAHSHHHVHIPKAESATLGWWGLVVLGVSGGIVPCIDAILTLCFAAATGHLWLGLPLLLAFSAGLAAVLIAIGILVVKTKGFAGSRWGESRFFRMLPVASAATVTCLGLWLCYTSAHSG